MVLQKSGSAFSQTREERHELVVQPCAGLHQCDGCSSGNEAVAWPCVKGQQASVDVVLRTLWHEDGEKKEEDVSGRT